MVKKPPVPNSDPRRDQRLNDRLARVGSWIVAALVLGVVVFGLLMWLIAMQ